MNERRLGKPFWTLLTSSSVSNLGDGVARVALPLLAATLTRDPLLIGSLTSFAFVPWLLFAMISGALVDRWDRKTVMIAANLFRAVVVGALTFAVYSDAAAIWMLFVAAFVLGTAETLYDGATRAILPSVVRRDQLTVANGRLESVEVVLQNFIGAPVGSSLFVIAAAGPFLANSAGFLIAALLLFLLPGSYRAVRDEKVPAQPPNLRREVGEGLSWLWRHRLLRPFVFITAIGAALFEGATAITVLLVIDTMELPEASFGFFMLLIGAGGVIGGLSTAALLRRFRRRTLLIAIEVGLGLILLGIGLAPVPAVVAAGFFLAGLLVLIWNVVSMTMRQTLIPAHLFGRVQGAWRTVVWGCLPLGGLLGGLLARVTDVPTVFLVAGVLKLATTVYLIILLKTRGGELDVMDAEDRAARARGTVESASTSEAVQTESEATVPTPAQKDGIEAGIERRDVIGDDRRESVAD
ncbi:MFS transporter [Actinoalloteichus hymeniacidonis]|uniref:Arabinose efflux permease family protein n=1 Tax=Actinoalloteichus hymeniacidonis TaxID=340345 RepID=A0AAC9HUA4_9PSEU|nr:MFS transporter [Actinoalloteichus hymeniacidonis]AOS65704.1 arabinose efflux permease family protein [Actinoalloteichus hymeniacidonis]MBB5906206.1 MFS family permease [Actinoalloteichus hymeniacidonis]